MTVSGWTVSRQHLFDHLYQVTAQRTFAGKTAAFSQPLALPWSVPVAQGIPVIGAVGGTVVIYGTATYTGSTFTVNFAGYGAAVTVNANGRLLLAD